MDQAAKSMGNMNCWYYYYFPMLSLIPILIGIIFIGVALKYCTVPPKPVVPISKSPNEPTTQPPPKDAFTNLEHTENTTEFTSSGKIMIKLGAGILFIGIVMSMVLWFYSLKKLSDENCTAQLGLRGASMLAGAVRRSY